MVDGKADGIGHDVVGCTFPVEVVDVGPEIKLIQRLCHIIEIVTAGGAVFPIALAVVGLTITPGAVAVIITQSAVCADVVVIVRLTVGQQHHEVLLAPVTDG